MVVGAMKDYSLLMTSFCNVLYDTCLWLWFSPLRVLMTSFCNVLLDNCLCFVGFLRFASK